MRIQARSRLRNIRRGNPPKRLGKRQWVGKREKRGPEHGLDFRGDGHEREVDPWRYRALACNLVRARRYRNHNPPFEVRCSAPALVVYQGPRKALAQSRTNYARNSTISPRPMIRQNNSTVISVCTRVARFRTSAVARSVGMLAAFP